MMVRWMGVRMADGRTGYCKYVDGKKNRMDRENIEWVDG